MKVKNVKPLPIILLLCIVYTCIVLLGLQELESEGRLLDRLLAMANHKSVLIDQSLLCSYLVYSLCKCRILVA